MYNAIFINSGLNWGLLLAVESEIVRTLRFGNMASSGSLGEKLYMDLKIASGNCAHFDFGTWDQERSAAWILKELAEKFSSR